MALSIILLQYFENIAMGIGYIWNIKISLPFFHNTWNLQDHHIQPALNNRIPLLNSLYCLDAYFQGCLDRKPCLADNHFWETLAIDTMNRKR